MRRRAASQHGGGRGSLCDVVVRVSVGLRISVCTPRRPSRLAAATSRTRGASRALARSAALPRRGTSEGCVHALTVHVPTSLVASKAPRCFCEGFQMSQRGISDTMQELRRLMTAAIQRPTGSSQEQVASMLALLCTGRASDALTACDRMLVVAHEAQDVGSDFRDVAGAAGAIEALLQVLRAHRRDPMLQLAACTALDNLCVFHERNCVRAGAAGAIDTVLALPQWTVASDQATELDFLKISRPLKVIGHLTVRNAENSAAAVAAGALPRVLAAMRAHQSSLEMQYVGCLCLQGLLKYSDAPRTSAVQAGAIADVLNAMHMHPGDGDLSNSACFALHELFSVADDIDADAQTRVHADAAMRAAVTALNAHRADKDVQYSGCALLYKLADGSGHVRATAVASGAVEAVAAALRAHPGHAPVQHCGVSAIVALTQGNRPAVAAAGSVELVLAAMGAHINVNAVQRVGCDALAFFLQNADEMNASMLARSAGAVVRAMREHSASAQILQIGVCALDVFVMHSAECLAIARDAGAVEALAAALRMSQRLGFSEEMENVMLFTIFSIRSLNQLVSAAPELSAAAAQDATVRGGVLEFIENTAQHAQEDAQVAEFQQTLLSHLDSSAQRHDGAPCAHAATCARCAAARARGEMCALPSCGARTRAPKDDAAAAKTRLLRCARCLSAMYCSAAHQKKDWAARHKAECRKPQQSAGDGASSSAGT